MPALHPPIVIVLKSRTDVNVEANRGLWDEEAFLGAEVCCRALDQSLYMPCVDVHQIEWIWAIAE